MIGEQQKRTHGFGLLAAMAVMLAACTTPVQTPKFPEITFTHQPAIPMNVARVEVVTRYKAPFASPNVDHLFPVTPAAAVERWAKDRIKPVGASGVAQLVLHDASVTENSLAKDTSLRGRFTTQQTFRYDLKLDVSLEITDPATGQRGFAETKTNRSTTAPEDLSINDREKLWFDFAEESLRAFDSAMEANVRQYLVNWVR